jgi:hypothetical protein
VWSVRRRYTQVPIYQLERSTVDAELITEQNKEEYLHGLIFFNQIEKSICTIPNLLPLFLPKNQQKYSTI